MEKKDVMITEEVVREADLVIHNGRIVKNRWGYIGATNVAIPDGAYRVIRIEEDDNANGS